MTIVLKNVQHHGMQVLRGWSTTDGKKFAYFTTPVKAPEPTRDVDSTPRANRTTAAQMNAANRAFHKR